MGCYGLPVVTPRRMAEVPSEYVFRNRSTRG
jgi:hypothetical protein